MTGGRGGGRLRSAALTALVTITGGVLGQLSRIPGGALLGSMFAVAGYNVLTDGAARMSPRVRHGGRILIGTTIGSLVTASLLSTLGDYLIGVVIITAAIVAIGLLAGWLLHRMTGLPLTTSLLASAPGGLAEMSVLAESLNARTELVVGVHVVRRVLTLVVVVVLVFAVGGP